MTTTAAPASLLDRAFGRRPSLALQIGLVFAGSLLLWLSAKIHVPFYPVPMTLQMLAIFILAGTLGFRLGVATVALYLAQGAFGLPVFSGTPEKGLGVAYMVGPTGGYLLGFLMTAGVVGWMADRGWTRSFAGAAFTAFLGAVAMYAPGLLWLGQFVGYGDKLLAFGLTPFVYGDALKIAIAGAVLAGATRYAHRRDA